MKNFFDLLYNGLYRFSSSGKSKNLNIEANNPNSFEFFREERKKQIQEKLGISIKNQNYFDEALIHRSYLHLLPKGLYQSNERLEFLGDSVLGFIVTEYLFHKYPNLPEGELTKIRSWLVNKHSLSVVAKKLEIDKLLLISFSTAKTLDRSGETILSDALEAIIAAIYLDSGYNAVKKFVTQTLIPLLKEEDVLQDKNYKSILMEKVQAEGKSAPTYEVLEEEGPPHDKTFRVGVYVDNILLATGTGRSKKEAEQNAAKNALEFRDMKKRIKEKKMEQLVFEKSKSGRKAYTLPVCDLEEYSSQSLLPDKFKRQTELHLPELSETEVARHFFGLSKLNYCIESGVYPLGSCTMKYNPKINEKLASLDGFANLHPHIDEDSAQGALRLMYELGESLKKITGFTGVTLQPASGSQGELTGILLFRAYHLDRGDTKRNKILIPDSAHGTNPASSTIAGYQVVSIKSDSDGRVNVEDLKKYCDDTVAGFMLTNPNTVGLFEKNILEIEKAVHGCGGLMYLDGANLNALLGIVNPADMGFDCMHINLHKTFSTPHGGGGPGAGPVCVNDKLKPYLPVPQIEFDGKKYHLNYDLPKTIGKVHSFFGNFLVFVRAYAYILINGTEGLKEVSKNAIINANYLLSKLKGKYHQPFKEFCMHEFLITGENQKKFGVTTKDIAKRILDFGLYAPTIYFPLIVHEAMLVEPTETETKERLDQYAEILLQIADEAEKNPEILLTAPHNTPIRRVDDARAARFVNVNYFKGETKG